MKTLQSITGIENKAFNSLVGLMLLIVLTALATLLFNIAVDPQQFQAAQFGSF